MICHECRGRTCIRCDVVWHPEVSCQDIQERRVEARAADEQASIKYLQANSKRCPNCKSATEKNRGCDHMTCEISSYFV